MSHTLAELQAAFVDYVIDDKHSLFASVQSPPQEAVGERAQIYACMYEDRLLEALQIEYPVTQYLLGEDTFLDYGIDFLTTHTSTSIQLQPLCLAFADFLADKLANELVGEMVTFERALSLATQAPDESVVTTDALQALAPEHWPTLTLQLTQSLYPLECQSNVGEVWHDCFMHLQEQTPRQVTPTWQSEAYLLLVWRQGLNPTFYQCSPAARWHFSACQSGMTFADVCTSLCEIMPQEEVPTVAASLLAQWVAAGLVVALISA